MKSKSAVFVCLLMASLGAFAQGNGPVNSGIDCSASVTHWKSKPFTNKTLKVDESMKKSIVAKGYIITDSSPEFEISIGAYYEYNDFINFLQPQYRDVRIARMQDTFDAVKRGESKISVRYWDSREDSENMKQLVEAMPSCQELRTLVKDGLKHLNGKTEKY